MTVVCPRGHTSATTDYCDHCGDPIVAVAAAQATQTLPVVEEADTSTSPAVRREPCPICGTERSGDDRYCENDGYDFESDPGAAVAWEAVATADRAQFERLSVPDLSFPDGYGERWFVLDRPELRIGRSRRRTGDDGGDGPEIDLAGSPEDPGISRLHAVLIRRNDGYAVRDLGSTNGTMVNDDPQPIGSDTGVPLADGDRIRLGAWTTITVRLRSRAGAAGQT